MYRKPIIVSLLSVFMLLFAAGCSPRLNKIPVVKDVIIYPTPPDTARIQFLTAFSSSEKTAGKQTAMQRFIFGESPVKPIKKPYGIAVHGGKIYICDTGLGIIEIIDLEKNTFRYFDPPGPGKLKLPLNCDVDAAGRLYVADGVRLQVVVFDENGKYLNAFGETDKFKPTDVCVSGDKIWVANIKNNNVLVYSKETYALLQTLPGVELGEPGFLYSPANLYVANGKVYVSDIGDFKVKVYDLEGNFLRSIGSNGTSPGQFVRPKGISVDKEENLYVVDASFENTQIFDREGRVLLFFGGPYKGPGDMWLPAHIEIDYDDLKYFQKYVDPAYKLNYLIFVTNQYGPDKVNVYGSILPK